MNAPCCLTIAGSDPSGGAGIQGDLKTFCALGAYGMAVITGLTVQNTTGVESSWPVPPEVVRRQIGFTLADIPCGAAKTGMLATGEIAQAVADEMRLHPSVQLVVDPVMVSTSGASLLANEALPVLKTNLLPLATIVTPNHPEAEALANQKIQSIEDMQQAVLKIQRLGPRYVLLKGGDFHPEGVTVTDVWTDGSTFEMLESPRIQTRNTHGSGCALAAALCVELARGSTPRDAMLAARAYVQKVILNSLNIGAGPGPVNHLGLS